jgi:hypothetical protein
MFDKKSKWKEEFVDRSAVDLMLIVAVVGLSIFFVVQSRRVLANAGGIRWWQEFSTGRVPSSALPDRNS